MKRCLGHKEGNQIVCRCCSKKMALSQYENHAGIGDRHQPRTLHDIALSLTNGEKIVIGCNADRCTVCQFRGDDLIHFAGCNRDFHAGFQLHGTLWHCPDTRRRNASVGESANSTGPAQLEELESISCVICRAHNLNSGEVINDRRVIICDQDVPEGNWLCCGDCNMINVTLENLVSKMEEPVADLLSIFRRHAEKGLELEPASYNAQWRIMRGKDHKPDQPLLLRAVEIFKENCI